MKIYITEKQTQVLKEKTMNLWHGTVKDFDSFDLSHSKEGMGHVAFGFGVYATNHEETAHFYAIRTQKDSQFECTFGGHEAQSDSEKIVNSYLVENDGNVYESFRQINELVKIIQDNIEDYDEEYLHSAQEACKLLSDMLNHKSEYIQCNKPKKIIYEVEVPEDNGTNYIEWFNIQPSQIENIAIQCGYDEGEPFENFQEFYESLSSDLGSAEEASKMLKSLGYDGVKIPTKYGDGFEYTIFDPNDVKIINKEVLDENSLKKVKNILNESITDITYHFTVLDSLENILDTNSLYLTLSSNISDTYHNKNLFYLSTQRTKSCRMGYASHKLGYSDYKGKIKYNSLVRIALNGYELNKHYQGLPLDYWGGSMGKQTDIGLNASRLNGYTPKDEDERKAVLKAQQRNSNFEFEDRIIADTPVIKDADKYIIRVDVLIGSEANDNALLFAKHLMEVNKADIPLYFYNDINSFEKQKGDITAQIASVEGEYESTSEGIHRNEKWCSVSLISALISLLFYDQIINYKENDIIDKIDEILQNFNLGEYTSDVLKKLNGLRSYERSIDGIKGILAQDDPRKFNHEFKSENANNVMRLTQYVMRQFNAPNLGILMYNFQHKDDKKAEIKTQPIVHCCWMNGELYDAESTSLWDFLNPDCFYRDMESLIGGYANDSNYNRLPQIYHNSKSDESFMKYIEHWMHNENFSLYDGVNNLNKLGLNNEQFDMIFSCIPKLIDINKKLFKRFSSQFSYRSENSVKMKLFGSEDNYWNEIFDIQENKMMRKKVYIPENKLHLLKEGVQFEGCRFEVSEIRYNYRLYGWNDPQIAQPFFGYATGEVVVKNCGTTHNDYRRLYADEDLCIIGRIWAMEDGNMFAVYIPCGTFYQTYGEVDQATLVQLIKQAYDKTNLVGSHKYYVNAWNNNYIAPLREEKQEHPEEMDEFMIGSEGNTSPTYYHVKKLTEAYGVKNINFDDVNEITFECWYDEDDFEEFLSENGITDTNSQEAQTWMKENLSFDISFYDRDYEYIGGVDTTQDMFDYEGIPDEISELILNTFYKNPKYDTEYRIDDVLYTLYSECDNIYDAAKKLFPTYDEYTRNLRGFILQDGTIIGTEMEHNEVTQLKGVESKFDFIRMGNIRIMPNSIDVGQAPSWSQRTVLRSLIAEYSDEVLYMDLFDGNTNTETGCQYTNPSWREVIADIDRFYDEGIKPTGGHGNMYENVIKEYHHGINDSLMNDAETLVKFISDSYIENQDRVILFCDDLQLVNNMLDNFEIHIKKMQGCAFDYNNNIIYVSEEKLIESINNEDYRDLTSLIYHELGHLYNYNETLNNTESYGQANNQMKPQFKNPMFLELSEMDYKDMLHVLYRFREPEMRARCFETAMWLKQYANEKPSINDVYDNRCSDVTLMQNFVNRLKEIAQNNDGTDTNNQDVYIMSSLSNATWDKDNLPHCKDWNKKCNKTISFFEKKLEQFKYRINKIYCDYAQGMSVNENMEYEVAPSEVDLSSFEKETTLTPKLWNNLELDGRARLKLLDIADDFIDFLNLSWVKPIDIRLTGSICNYNWSEFSDIDVHIIMDLSEIDERNDIVREYVDMKKNIWNEEHEDLEIYGFPVELYVEDVNEEAVSEGVYSLMKNEWIKEPNPNNIENIKHVDEEKIKLLASSLMTEIDDIEEEYNTTDDLHQIEILNKDLDKIAHFAKEMRTKSLDDKGEMGNGNIIYKLLRRFGYLDKLWDLQNKIYDKINSL